MAQRLSSTSPSTQRAMQHPRLWHLRLGATQPPTKTSKCVFATYSQRVRPRPPSITHPKMGLIVPLDIGALGWTPRALHISRRVAVAIDGPPLERRIIPRISAIPCFQHERPEKKPLGMGRPSNKQQAMCSTNPSLAQTKIAWDATDNDTPAPRRSPMRCCTGDG